MFVHNFEKCRPMLKILTLLNSAVNLPRDLCQGHREFPSGIPWNSREFAFIKFPAGIPGNLAYRIFIFFLLESALCKTAIYIQKLTHFIHKSIQYYIKIIDNNTKHQKFLEPAQLMGLWQLSQPL